MISVLGSGIMGKGIAIEFARFNYKVQLITISGKSSIHSIKSDIEYILERLKYTNKDDILDNLCISNDISILSNSNLIIEAICEDFYLKRELLKIVNRYIKFDAILGSNTSSLSITQLFKNIHSPDKIVGIHFFNPVHIMKLVEVAYTTNTSEETIKYVKNIMYSLEKEAIVVKDSPGFIVNRLLIPMINEASKLIDEGVATAEDIDRAMKLGANHPIGPLKLSDLIGNDITLSILKILKDNLEDNGNISKKLENLVEEEKLGRKSNAGYYKY